MKILHNIPIAIKLSILVITPLVLSLFFTVVFIVNRFNIQEQIMVASSIQEQISMLRQQITQTEKSLVLRADSLSSDPIVVKAFNEHNQQYLQSRFELLVTNMNLSHVQAVYHDSTVIATQQSTDFTGVNLLSLHQQGSTGTTGVVLTKQGWMLVVVRPVKNNDEIVGTVSLGLLLNNKLLSNINFQRANPRILLLDTEGNIITFSEAKDTEVDPANFAHGVAIDYTLWQKAQQGNTVIGQGDGYRVAYTSLMPGLQSDVVIAIAFSTARITNMQQDVVSYIVFVSTTVSLIAAVLVVLWGYLSFAKPITALTRSVQSIANGHLDEEVPGENRHDELGILANTFHAMTVRLREMVGTLESRVQERTSALQHQMAALQRQMDENMQLTHEIAQHRSTIEQMSIPVLPLTSNVFVVPLVGELNTERLALLQQQTLVTIQQSKARYLVIDITGVLVVDSQVAEGLMHVVRAARLIGVQVIFVGIRPDVAQSIVGLGLHVGGIKTFATLQDSLHVLMHQ